MRSVAPRARPDAKQDPKPQDKVMVTFSVDDVRAETPTSWPATPMSAFLDNEMDPAKIKRQSVEAWGFSAGGLLRAPNRNSFLETALNAYDRHIPLVLSPDDVWLAVCQAISKHIEQNPEDARRALVGFQGKPLLEILADDFVKGSPNNDWPRVFEQFGDEIEKFLGRKRDLFDPSFTTTTAITRAAIQVQMMGTLAPYFDYQVTTRCGLPTITLLGTTDDWRGVVERVSAFGEFYPQWAHAPLLRVVQQFERASRGDVDKSFWCNFVKGESMSGGYHVSGYINAFFPYLDGEHGGIERNTAIAGPSSNGHGARLGTFPGSVTSVPVLWDYCGTKFHMRLATGIFGTCIDTSQTNGLRPIIGWVLGEEA